MERIYVEVCGTGLIYESDIPLYDYLREHLIYIELPGIKVTKDIPKQCNYYIKYRDSKNHKFFCTNNTMIIEYPRELLTPASIIHIGYVMIEKQQAERGSIICHSACVAKEGKSILLLGRSGSGKTTVSLKLCIDNEFSLVSNDRTIIDFSDGKQLKATEGTKFLLLREESIRRNLPELLYLFPNTEKDSWENKIKIIPSKLGINIENNVVPIAKVYKLHVDNEQGKLNVIAGDNPVNRMFLNEVFSMGIRGVYTTFCDKNFKACGYVPSFDTENTYLKRCSIIEEVVSSCQMEYISGNLNDVCAYMNETHSQMIKR